MGKIRYLFPDKHGEASQELYDHALWIIDKVNTGLSGHIDKTPPEGGITILFQGTTRYLQLHMVDIEYVAFEGNNTASTSRIEGVAPVSDNLAFLGEWLDQDYVP